MEVSCGVPHLIFIGNLSMGEGCVCASFQLEIIFVAMSPIKWYLSVVEVILTRGSGGLEPEKHFLFFVVGGLLRLHLMIGLVVALVDVLS